MVDRPLKVLHVINSLGLGGAEALLYRLIVRDRAVEHVVVSLASADWFSPLIEEAGVQVFHLDMDSAAAVPGGILRLNQIIRQSGAEVVQCWMYRSNLLGGLLAKIAGKRVVWGIHCSSLEPLRPASRALAYLSGIAARWNPDFVINCSRRSQELHARIGFAAAPGSVIHNGYDPAAFFPDQVSRVRTRRQLGIEPDAFLIGTVARWHAQKDIPNLLRALRIARDEGVPVTCLLAGSGLGVDNPGLVKQIEANGCEALVVPLGPRSDIVDIARAIDLHVLASCGAEAFPNAVAETMLSGTPNAVTDVGDSALMVGGTGWVVPPRNARALANAIIEAYREFKSAKCAWEKRGMAARLQIASNFTIERMANAYEQVWRDLVCS